MNNAESLWDYMHTTNNKNSLSGSSFDATVDFLKVRDFVKPGMRVLEIGCGLGYVTRQFSDIGEVSVVDVSHVGLNRVADICKNTYHSTETHLLPDDYFDLIVCHNVVQHVPTSDLRCEMKDFIRSLKPSGLFAVEFVSAQDVDDLGENPSLHELRNGFLCRSPKFIGDMVSEFGGKCHAVYSAPVQVPPITGVHVFHITKLCSTKKES